MMTRRLACPSCGAGLKVAMTLPVGKKITCPKCEESFRIPEEEDDEAPPPKARAAASRKAPPRDDEDDYEEERPRTARKRKPKPAGSSLPLILGLVIGGLVLVGGGVTAAILLWPEKKPSGPLASGAPLGKGSEKGTAKTGGEPKGGGGARVAAGLEVYRHNNCAKCHTPGNAPGGGGKGGRSRLDLSSVGAKRDIDWLMAHVRNAKQHNPRSRMPAYGEDEISAKDLRALAEYLASLK